MQKKYAQFYHLLNGKMLNIFLGTEFRDYNKTKA